MAKHIDLTNKFSKEKPTITMGDLILTINDEKSNVLMMNSALKNSEGLTEIEMIDKSIEILVGKKGLQSLEKLKLSMKDYKTFYFALVAVVNDQELSEVEENFRKTNQ